MTITVVIMIIFTIMFVLSFIRFVLEVCTKRKFAASVIAWIVSILGMTLNAPFLKIKSPEIYATNGNSIVE